MIFLRLYCASTNLLLNTRSHASFFFRKDTPNQSDAVRRFLADITQKWVSYHEPNELATQVVTAIVLDLLKNYRHHRLPHTDIMVMLMFCKSLGVDHSTMQEIQKETEKDYILSREPWEPEMVFIPAGPFWMGLNIAQAKLMEALSKKLIGGALSITHETAIAPHFS